MHKIILDTNFLLVPEQFKVDIFDQINKLFLDTQKLFIVDKTIEELQKIVKAGGKDKVAAKVAIQLVERFKVEKISTLPEDYADNAIVKICSIDNSYVVATNDVELKQRLKKFNIRTIELRQKKYLVLR